jgi:hypothetical protein
VFEVFGKLLLCALIVYLGYKFLVINLNFKDYQENDDEPWPG